MKWLILLLIIIAVGGLIAYRFRHGIMAVWQIWQMFKEVKDLNKKVETQFKDLNRQKESKFPKNETQSNQNLVRCAKCGKWTPQNQAVNLRKQMFYCSMECVNEAVKKV